MHATEFQDKTDRYMTERRGRRRECASASRYAREPIVTASADVLE